MWKSVSYLCPEMGQLPNRIRLHSKLDKKVEIP